MHANHLKEHAAIPAAASVLLAGGIPVEYTTSKGTGQAQLLQLLLLQ
jgi:hypothetical protein